MILLYFTSGLLLALLGALPPGASNLAVVKASLEGRFEQSQKLSLGAGFGEVALAIMAVVFGMVVQDFIGMHLWVQWALLFVFAGVGIYFLSFRESQRTKKKPTSSQYLTGFLLSVVNPPVLLYWVLAITLLQSFFTLNKESSLLLLGLFFVGVFLGKITALFGYTRLAKGWAKNSSSKPQKTNKIIGIALLSIASVQALKLVLV